MICTVFPNPISSAKMQPVRFHHWLQVDEEIVSALLENAEGGCDAQEHKVDTLELERHELASSDVRRLR